MNKYLRVYELLLSEFGSQQWWPVISGSHELEVCLGAILTQNTSWKNVEKAIKSLKDNNLVSVEGILKISSKKLAAVIKPAGYYNQKAKKLKNLCRFLIEEYKGDAQLMGKEDAGELRQKLLGINGVGEETADSIILYAASKPSFVVDAYTRRVFSRLGLTSGKESYGEIRKSFTDNLPNNAKLFNEYHALIVRLGKDFCRKKPLCGECPLADLCRRRI